MKCLVIKAKTDKEISDELIISPGKTEFDLITEDNSIMRAIALQKQTEIDKICGYPMEYTKHAIDIVQDLVSRNYGVQIAVVDNMKIGGKYDIEKSLTIDELKEVFEWSSDVL